LRLGAPARVSAGEASAGKGMALELVFDSDRHLDERDPSAALDMSRKFPKNRQ
jgi:hypothetical protein